MRYEQDFIEKVRDANNIVDVIGQYTELKAKGSNHMGLCPFPDHNEKSPSFSVSEGKQLYHCFGCKKSGNIFTFLETYNGFSFVESLEYLAGRAHIAMPEPEPMKPGQPQRKRVSQDMKQNLFKANKFAAVFYHQKLKSLSGNKRLQDYLKKRNLSEELIETFRIGYAPEAWDELTNFLAGKKVPVKVSEKLGLIRQNKKGGHFDLFRDRLMFPIFSIDSQVIGFGGRIIDQGQPKYINSVESDVFKKGQSFYGVEQAVKHIRSEDRAFVVEGYMDLLALYGKDVKNVVATLGTALTDKHVRLIKRWTKNVVLLFDGDAAGQSAAERSLIHFFQQDLLPQVLVLPNGQDPDDFINAEGTEKFNEVADNAQDLYLHLVKTWLQQFKGTPKDKIELVDKIAPLLKALSDKRLLQMYIEETARLMNEDARTLYRWVMEGKKTSAPAPQAPPMTPMAPEAPKIQKVNLEKVAQDELVLLGLSLKSPKFMNFLKSNQVVDYLGGDTLKPLFASVVAEYGQHPENFDKLAHLVVSKVQNPEKIVNLINISSEEEGSDHDENQLKECLIRVKDRFLQRQAAVLVAEMKSQPDEGKLERFVNIQNDRKALKDLKNIPLGD